MEYYSRRACLKLLRGLSGGNTNVNSIFVVTADCRHLRGRRPGDWRLFAWRMFGFDRAGIYRRIAGQLARQTARSSGIAGAAGRRYEISNCLVDYRRGPVCSGYQFDQPPAGVKDWSASVPLAFVMMMQARTLALQSD